MKIALRRQLAGAAATATLAALVVTLAPTTATAAAIVSVSPPAQANTAGEVRITITTQTPFLPAGDPDARTGTQVELVRTDTVGGTEDLIRGDVVEGEGGGTTVVADFVFAGSATQAPPNPGRYNVYVYTGSRSAGDSCTNGCFSLFSSAPTIASSNPTQLPSGVQGQVFSVTGTGFGKATTVQAVFAGTTTVDPNITFTAATRPATPTGREDIPNTATLLQRTIRVDPLTTPGFRDLVVTNTDRQTATRVDGLRITTLKVDRLDPSAGSNASSVRSTLTGRGFPVGSAVRLINEATPTVGTIVGTSTERTSATSLTTTFDLNGAMEGTYRVQVSSPDGSTTTPECSPTFTVVNVLATRPAGTASTRTTTPAFSCAEATTTSPTPSATASSTASPTASSSPSPSGGLPSILPGGSASPSRSATPTASTSPSASPSGPPAPEVATDPSTINCQESSTVVATAQPNTRIELYAYSRPSTTYAKVREGIVGGSGRIEFRVGPCGNTRLYARSFDQQGNFTDSASTVITVRTSINLRVVRVGTRTYRFTGTTLPKRRNQLVTVFYQRTDGSNRVIASRARTDSNGRYEVVRQFGGTGTFDLFTGTGTDINNAAGTTRKVRTTIR